MSEEELRADLKARGVPENDIKKLVDFKFGQLKEYEEVSEEKSDDRALEFVSRVETVKAALELNFPPCPGFGKYRQFYPMSDGKNPDAVAHPAKMSTLLCEYLITRYTSVGDTVLDPMSGAGTTAAVGAPLGRNVVTVELEQKFVDWQKGLKTKIEEAPMLMKGEITVIKGDARTLSKLLGVVDAEVVSPPYSASLRRKNRNVKDLDRLLKAGYSEKWIKQHHDQPNQNIAISGQGYSKDPNNIGNLRMETQEAHMPARKNGLKTPARAAYFGDDGYGEDPGNIGKLPIDGILTSPPYEGSEAFQDTDFVKEISGDLDKKVIEGKSKGHPKQSARMLKYKTGAHIGQGHAPSSAAEARFLDKAEKGRISHPDSIGKLTSSDAERTFIDTCFRLSQSCQDLTRRLDTVLSAASHATSEPRDAASVTIEGQPTGNLPSVDLSLMLTEEALASITQASSLGIATPTEAGAFLSLLGLTVHDGKAARPTGEELGSTQLRLYLGTKLALDASSAGGSLPPPPVEGSPSRFIMSSPSKKEARTTLVTWLGYW